jgi:hypothetical protein
LLIRRASVESRPWQGHGAEHVRERAKVRWLVHLRSDLASCQRGLRWAAECRYSRQVLCAQSRGGDASRRLWKKDRIPVTGVGRQRSVAEARGGCQFPRPGGLAAAWPRGRRCKRRKSGLLARQQPLVRLVCVRSDSFGGRGLGPLNCYAVPRWRGRARFRWHKGHIDV